MTLRLRTSVCFVLSFVILATTFSSPLWSQQANEDSPKVKELKLKRLVALKGAYDAVNRPSASMPYEGERDLVRAIAAEYFAAMRDYAETQVERIQACEAVIKYAEKLLQRATAWLGKGNGSITQEYMCQAFVLESQITLEKNIEDKRDRSQTKELHEKLTQALEIAFEAIKKEDTPQRPIDEEVVLEVTTRFFAARRENAETLEKRLQVLEEEAEEVERMLENAKKKHTARRGTILSVLRLQAYLLNTQIELQKAKEANEVGPRAKKLQAERLDVLGEAFTIVKSYYVAARVDQKTVLDVMSKYFAARRDDAGNREERIKVIEEEAHEAESLLELAEARTASLRGTVLCEFRIKARLLDAQISLEYAKGGQ